MSATLDLPTELAAPPPPPPIRAASLADINEMGPWLLPRICEAFQVSDHQAIAFLRGALPSNDQRLIVCGDAIGMVHIEPGRMGRQVKAVVDFVPSPLKLVAQPQVEGGLEYDLRKNLKLDFMTGGNDNGQEETKLGLNYRAMLPDIMSAQPGDKQTPKFLRFDILEIGLGKYQLNWQTDLVTKSEVSVLDENKNVVQNIVEKGQHAYDHELVLDKLNPQEAYQVQITTKYLNGNEAVSIKDISPQVQP